MNRNSVAQLISRARIKLRDGLRGTARSRRSRRRRRTARRALPLLALAQDGELDDATSADWLARHLVGCATCRVRVEAMQEAGAAYRLWMPLVPVLWLRDAAVAKAAERTSATSARITRPRTLVALAGVGLGLLLAVADVVDAPTHPQAPATTAFTVPAPERPVVVVHKAKPRPKPKPKVKPKRVERHVDPAPSPQVAAAVVAPAVVVAQPAPKPQPRCALTSRSRPRPRRPTCDRSVAAGGRGGAARRRRPDADPDSARQAAEAAPLPQLPDRGRAGRRCRKHLPLTCPGVIRAWARTLPERCGGKLMFAALLAVLALALVLRVWAATHAYDFRHGSDADQYERLAARLFGGGGFGIPGSENPYDFAPGEPYFAAAVYWLIGDVDPTAARIGMAIAGTLAVLVVFLLGRRLGGPLAGVIGAALAAVYPAAIFYTSLFSSEPIAMLTVGGAILAFLWANDPGRTPWAWLLPGALFGLTAYLRPEYLLLTLLFALLALVLVARRGGLLRGVLAGAAIVFAFAVVIAPWTIHVSNDLGRFVPVSTGGGKALFIGTYLPGDGIHEGVKQHLLHEIRGGPPIPEERLRRIPMNPLLDRVANRYPDLPRDEALQKVGRDEPRALLDAPAVRLRVDDGRQDRPHVARRRRPELHVRRLGLPLHRGRARAVRTRAAGTATSLGGPADRASARGHQLHRRAAAGRGPRNLPVMPIVLALAGVTVAAAVSRFLARRYGKEPGAWRKNS